MPPRPDAIDAMPALRRLEDFDQESGTWLERLIFRHRPIVGGAAAAVTLALGWVAAARHVVNADFEQTMPAHHPFVQTYREHRDALRGLGNTLYVAVENPHGDIYDPRYLEALRQLSDELFLTAGVDRVGVRSLWTPAVRWREVTEEGFRGGPVVPDGYDGSPGALGQVRRNVARAGLAGTLVADDSRSSMVVVPLLDRDPGTGAGIDYPALARRLDDLRRRFEGDRGGPAALHVIGFASLVGELLAGVRQVMAYFAAAAAIAAVSLFLFTRCVRSTVLVVACAGAGVVWQLGLVAALRIPLDPFSVLVPFLVFAMGVSHGSQKMNGIMQDVGRGTHRLVAARYTFRRLFLPGLTAILTDAAGFAVLLLVDVPAIQLMAETALLGTAVLVFTSLILLPVLLSYVGVSASAAARSLRAEAPGGRTPLWRVLERLTDRRWAAGVLAASAFMVTGCAIVARHLQVGDLEPGAPELRASSRYNRDDAFIAAHYLLSSDLFAVVVETPPDGCLDRQTLVEADRLEWALLQVPGVRATSSLADAVRLGIAGSFEGHPKWLTLSRDQQVLNWAAQQALAGSSDLVDARATVMPVAAYLTDHAAGTLDGVVRVAEDFAHRHRDPERRFLLAAGSAGIQAATNEVVREARWIMAGLSYAAVILLCLVTFRSWRAVVVTVLPLAATTVACNAVMVWLGIGTKLSTLPVIALGVGIPDFALYLLSVQLAHQRAGEPLEVAYPRALRFTGRAIVLVSVTLAAGVVTWAWSPLALQADMGLLLTFMFLGNMAAALALVPALSRFLLSDVQATRGATPTPIRE